LNSLTRRLDLNRKALRDLGLQQMGLYAWYRLALRSGAIRRIEARQVEALRAEKPVKIASPLDLPEPREIAALTGDDARDLVAEAGEILAGQVRLFGGPPAPLQLSSPDPLSHWTEYEGKSLTDDGKDIKFTWEPGRFGWAFTLGRAFHLTRDDRYAAAFWERFESFSQANPPFQGPHWASAQEVGLRLIALAFAAQVFAPSPQSTQDRLENLSMALALHAVRIPLTLAYARAQNNNHLLTEAAGLVTAGTFLPGHSKAEEWRRLGWRWFNTGLQTQITEDGAYTQNSCNYHRLMLQAALWVQALGKPFPEETCRRLADATRWLLALVDPDTGRVPNLGPNDGAYILPLASCPYFDYRPVLQAASRAFLGRLAFESGPWDEMALWLGKREDRGGQEVISPVDQRSPRGPLAGPHTLRLGERSGWGYLRAARFTGRPGHADQLHLDLWWQGLNIAQDAGTYLYNALPPWDNALAGTEVHNTLTIAGLDQMTRAGRFLWLDWAQARVIASERAPDGPAGRLVAEHDGYRRLGITHRRSVSAHESGRWTVEDSVLPSGSSMGRTAGSQPQVVRLHWLLPDWPWEIECPSGSCRAEIRLSSPLGMIVLKTRVEGPESFPCYHTLARAGELLSGVGPVSPTWGWVSPTYGVKEPALSYAFHVVARPPVALISEWVLP
jgi:hypothetical protein